MYIPTMNNTTENPMPCYCKLDTPCQPCIDKFHEACDRDGNRGSACGGLLRSGRGPDEICSLAGSG